MNRSNAARANVDDSPPALPFESDELGALADRADWLLLRLVGCTALSTLLLAAAISLAR